MSSNEIISRKSRYSDKFDENSSLCNRSLKSEFNNLSIDLPHHHRQKHSSIEREILGRRGVKAVLTVNLASTKYPILQEVCGQSLGWRVQNFGETRAWQLKWCDTGVVNETLQRMTSAQRINHFPAMSVICRKNTLALTLARMKDQFPLDYDFFPRTFLLPNDSAKLYHYFAEARRRGLAKTFIVKPEAGCQGRGIYLCQNPAELEKEERCVVQKYVANPLLFRGLKFDLRIYVLLACADPLRIYLYNQGLVRFATEPYELPTQGNLDNYYMHLTNYAINKSNPNYQYNYSTNDLSHGHKKSLAEFFQSLKEMGLRANAYWAQIKDCIVKTLLAAQPQLVSNYRLCRPQEAGTNMCFELLGFDFMMDNQERVYLLEVNHTPSFSTDTPLDHLIKKNLIKDTILMMAPTPEEGAAQEQLDRLRQREKFIKFRHGSESSREREELLHIITQIRTQNQEAFKGTYQQIYPHKAQARQEKYERFLAYSVRCTNGNPSSNNVSSVDLRNRLKEAPKGKVMSKQQLAKIIPPEPKKNIIYNYNVIKHPTSSKKALQTLPVERIRADSHPVEQSSSTNKSSRFKEKLKTETSSTREIRSRQPSSNYHSEEKRTVLFDSKIKALPGRRSEQKAEKESVHKDLNSFTKRIRSYKTPLML